MPQHMNPCPGGHEINNFGKTLPWSLLLNTKFVWTMPRRGKEDFLKNTPILPQNYLPLGLGAMKFTISCLLTLQMLHIKFG